MKCPECKAEQYCPCWSCRDRLPDGKKAWIDHRENDTIECAYCGLTKHMDWWETEAWKQYKEAGDGDKDTNDSSPVPRFLNESHI